MIHTSCHSPCLTWPSSSRRMIINNSNVRHRIAIWTIYPNIRYHVAWQKSTFQNYMLMHDRCRKFEFYLLQGTIIKHPRFKPANTRVLIDEIIEFLIDNTDSLATRFTSKSIRDFITDPWRWWCFQRVKDEIRIITNGIWNNGHWCYSPSIGNRQISLQHGARIDR